MLIFTGFYLCGPFKNRINCLSEGACFALADAQPFSLANQHDHIAPCPGCAVPPSQRSRDTATRAAELQHDSQIELGVRVLQPATAAGGVEHGEEDEDGGARPSD